MNTIAVIEPAADSLPALVDRAARALAGARSSAEVLEAGAMASFAYDAAKKTGRLAKAKQAHDDLIAAAYRAQADALEIEAAAKRRLADEYDAALERGEVASHGGARNFKVPDGNVEPTAADAGLSRKDIHEARKIRDAEQANPGIVRRTLNDLLARGEEPSKAALRETIGLQEKAPAVQGRKQKHPDVVSLEAQLALVKLWHEMCPAAQDKFREWVRDAPLDYCRYPRDYV